MMSQKQLVLTGFLGIVGLAMLAGMIAILFPSWNGSDELLGSLILTAFYALGLMALVIYGKRMPKSRMLSVIALVVSLVFYLVGIWFSRPLSRQWESVVWSGGFISVAIAGGFIHRIFVWPIKLNRLGLTFIKWASILCAMSTVGIVVCGFVFMGTSYWGEAYLRVVWMSVVLTTGTTIATGVAALFGMKPDQVEDGMIGTFVQVSLTCPRCGAAASAVSNKESRCAGCKLKVRIEIEEPRCTCGYSLYQLESDACPECGRAISDDDRWMGTQSVTDELD